MTTKKSKHTPGPYGLYENKGTAFMTITRPDKDGIRVVGLAVNDPEAKRQMELEATSALFKAAPELLAALEFCADALNTEAGGLYKAHIEQARAAIAKAKGIK